MVGPGRRFLPRRAPIEAYGAGGFRFAEMSHRGSLLALPSGMHAWAVARRPERSTRPISPLSVAEAGEIDLLLVGTGRDLVSLPDALRWRLRDLGMAVEIMPTAAAIRTWNVLLAEDRRVAAALVAVH